MSMDPHSAGAAFKRLIESDLRDMVVSLLSGLSATVAAQKDGLGVSDQHRVLNFQGSGVAVSDDPAARRTNVFIPGSPTSSSTVSVMSAVNDKCFDLPSGNTEPAGWQAVGFVDSGWTNAVGDGHGALFAPYSGSAWITASNATHNNANDRMLFRKPIVLPAGSVSSASLQVGADNYTESVYINGTLVAGNTTVLDSSQTFTLPTSAFTPGATNELAIRVKNATGTIGANWIRIDFRLDVNMGASGTDSQYELVVHKGAASGYAALDSGSLVPTAELGAGAASGTTFLRGDQTWAAASTNAVTVDEVDGVPSVSATRITFPNGTLTDNTGGHVSFNGAGVVGNNVYTSAYASPPGAPNGGDLWLPSDGIGIIFRYSGAAWVPWGPLFPFIAPPAAASWTWVNQGTASVADSKGAVILSGPSASGSTNLRLLVRTAPATPWTVTAAFFADLDSHGASETGLCFRASGAGTIHTMAIAAGLAGIASRKWTSPTAFSADYVNTATIKTTFPGAVVVWMRLQDDGTNRILSHAVDGQTWRTVHSVARTDFLTANQVGIYSRVDSGFAGMQLLSWTGA